MTCRQSIARPAVYQCTTIVIAVMVKFYVVDSDLLHFNRSCQRLVVAVVRLTLPASFEAARRGCDAVHGVH